MQRVIGNIGQLDQLQQDGTLDAMLLSGMQFSERLDALRAFAQGDGLQTETLHIGPALLFESIWKELSIDKVILSLVANQRYRFSVERALFLTVLHRMFFPGSDRAAEKWKNDYKINGCSTLGLHHLYRAMKWLGTMLPMKKQDDISPFVFKTNKDMIEEELFFASRDLFTGLQIVFFDTTSLYFEGRGGLTLGKYGHSKDHRTDLRQIVVGVVLDNKGNPICSEILPGNTSDVKTLVPVAQRLEKRFGISHVCIVADRGMISDEVLAEIEKLHWSYILGVRMRKRPEIAKHVLNDTHRFIVIHPERSHSKDPAPLKVKEVLYEGTRYIVCRNEEEVRKDSHDREAIVKALSEALHKGDKSLVGNKGYRRFLKSSGGKFSIDEDTVLQDALYDGIWVLTTNTDLPMADVALKYKELWMVEDIFRTMKSTLETRPIYHKYDETITGHVFCSFLALKLRKHLQDKINDKGWKLEWADVIRDVNELQEITLKYQNKQFIIRTEIKGVAGKVFQAAKVALPPVVQLA